MNRTHADSFDIAELAKDEFVQYASCRGYFELIEEDAFGGSNALIAQRAYLAGKNLYLGVNSKASSQQALLPILYSAACRLMQQCSPGYMPPFDDYKHKCAFISGKDIWRYSFKDGKHALTMPIKAGKRTRFIKDPDLLPATFFISIDPECTNQRGLGTFQNFYHCLTGNEEHAPSFFPAKIMVVCNKTDLFMRLRKLELFHCFPMADVISQHIELTNSSLPIDPLVLVASSYDTAREYILSQNGYANIDYLIVNAESKAGAIRSQIKNDWANGLFSKYCLIGCQVISTDNSMTLWHWDHKEEMKIMGTRDLALSLEPMEDCWPLIEATNTLYKCLDDLQEDYGNPALFGRIRHGLNKVLSDKLNRLSSFDQEIGNPIRGEIIKSLLADNYDEEDFTEDLDIALEYLRGVYLAKAKCSDYLDVLIEKQLISRPLVVRNSCLQDWQNLTKRKLGGMGKIISFREFFKELINPAPRFEYIFTFLPSPSQIESITSKMLKKDITVRLILYPPEISIFRARLRKIRRWHRTSEGSKDTSLIPNLSFTITEREASEDIIERLEAQHTEDLDDLGMAGNRGYEVVSYSIQAMDQHGSAVTVSTPQKVLRKCDDSFELVQVTDLENGDPILVYANESRDSLYEILSKESDRLASVNYYSRLWKDRLWAYIRSEDTPERFIDTPYELYADKERLSRLSRHTGQNADYIFKHWIRSGSTVFFPQKTRLERILSFLREQGLMNLEEKEQIKASRGFFMGVMISLGQNLSSEAQQILLNKDGDLSGFITKHVIGNPRSYPLLSRFDLYSVIGILGFNFHYYTFISIAGQEENRDYE